MIVADFTQKPEEELAFERAEDLEPGPVINPNLDMTSRVSNLFTTFDKAFDKGLKTISDQV